MEMYMLCCNSAINKYVNVHFNFWSLIWRCFRDFDLVSLQWILHILDLHHNKILTAIQIQCNYRQQRKVSEAFVSHSVNREVGVSTHLHPKTWHLPPVASGRYASYWNTFLLVVNLSTVFQTIFKLQSP